MPYAKGEPFVQAFFDANGDPLVNGTVEFYIWNTSTPTAVYSDASGTSAGTSVTLDSNGAPANSGTPIDLYFDVSVVYKIVRKDSAGSPIAPTIGPYYGTGVGGSGVAITIDAVDVNASNSLYDYIGTTDGQRVDVGGYYTVGDGGGGQFYWDASSSDSDDAGLTILPTGHAGAGRWRRVYDAVINIKWLGAKGDGVANDSAKFQTAIDDLYGDGIGVGGGMIYVPAGTYKATGVMMRDDITIYGDGMTATIIQANSDAPTFKMYTGEVVERIGWRDLCINGPGDTSMPNQDGISFDHDKPMNYIDLYKVRISNSGRYGMNCVGTGAGVGFGHVQRLTMINSDIVFSQSCGLRMEHAHLENTFINCFLNGNALDGTSNGCEFIYGFGDFNHIPVRTTLINCVLNAPATTGAAVYIDGASNLVLDCCDFESCKSAVYIAATSTAWCRNITIKNCSFTWQSFDADYGIYYTAVSGLHMINNEFKIRGGSTVGTLVKGAATGYPNEDQIIYEPSNTIFLDSGAITTPFDFNNKTVAVGNNGIDYSITYVKDTNVIDVDSPPTELHNILDTYDRTDRIPDGARCRLVKKFDGKPIHIRDRESFTITGATQANPVVITSTGHGLNNGDVVYISGVAGMTELNGEHYIVANSAANTFEIQDLSAVNINGTGYTAYTSGGTARRGNLKMGKGDFYMDLSDHVIEFEWSAYHGLWVEINRVDGFANISGVDFFDTSGTLAITFPFTLPVGTYEVQLTGDKNETFWFTSRSATGFTANSSNASSTAILSWRVRYEA